MNIKLAWLVTPLLLASVHLVEAQQPKKIYRVGFLSAGSASSNVPRMQAFRQAMRELGYIEGKNILIEYRYMKGNQNLIPSLVAELVQLNVDVLVSGVYPTIRAAKQATHTIPIVMVITQDPVKTGLSSRFPLKSRTSETTPVIFPPGRAKLVTSCLKKWSRDYVLESLGMGTYHLLRLLYIMRLRHAH